MAHPIAFLGQDGRMGAPRSVVSFLVLATRTEEESKTCRRWADTSDADGVGQTLPDVTFGILLSSPKKAHKHNEMGPQNWTLDPTPKPP